MARNSIKYINKTINGVFEHTINLDSVRSYNSIIELSDSKLKIKLKSGNPEVTYFGFTTGHRGNMYLRWSCILEGEICPNEYQRITEPLPIKFKIKGETEYFKARGEAATKHHNVKCTGISFTSESELKFPNVVKILVNTIKDHQDYNVESVLGRSIQLKTYETSKIIDSIKWH